MVSRERVFLAYQRLRLRSPALRRAVQVVPGAAHVHRRLFSRVRPAEITLEIRGLTITVDPVDAVLAAHLIRDGVWEPYETELFTECIQPGMVVVDVGANVGYYTLLAAQAVGPEGRVVAFEPDPRNFELLDRNVEANGFRDRATLLATAVGADAGAVTLHRDTHNLGAHSLAGDNVSGTDIVEVPCTTLDDALRSLGIDRVDVIKIDTQGAEGLVFAGAERVASSRPLRVFTEYWPLGLRRMGTDPGQLVQTLSETYGFQISFLDQQHSRLVEATGPDDLLSRCEGGNQLDLLLETT